MELDAIDTTLVRAAEGGDARHYCLLRLRTDAGVEGVGEATAPGMERATEMAVHDLGRHLVGRDPRNVEGLWDHLYDAYAWNFGAVSMTALSGIEMALWDLLGKHHGVRVCDLLGGPMRERLRVYANGVLGGSPAECADAAVDVRDRGYGMVKFMPFRDPEGDAAWTPPEIRDLGVERLEAVSEATDDLDVAVELHGVNPPQVAADLADLAEPFDPVFVEEPVPPENDDAMRRVRDRVDVPIATGERLLTTFEYRDFFQHPTPADIVQPDVNNVGGISQLKKVAAMAATEYVPVAPHNSRGPVATAAAAHACATIPNFLVLEYFPDWPPWRGDLIEGSERVEDGHYHLPEGDGLGVTVDWEVAAEYPYEKADRAEAVYTRGYRDPR
ncbi:MAG: mandelate racemase/muconate lactonizing enzyme family protein [Halobacteriales archaeon]